MPIPPPRLVVEQPEISTAGTSYKLFMSANLPSLMIERGEDRAKSWLIEIEKAFDDIELSERFKVKYRIYILVDDAESWWHIQLAISYDNVQPE